MKRWYGKLFGFFAGAALLRSNPPLGALIGLLIGHAFDADWFARTPKESPYRVLGLKENASQEQVDLAYRRMMAQYHPDKVARKSDDARKRAEAKARAINAAYDQIQALRHQDRV